MPGRLTMITTALPKRRERNRQIITIDRDGWRHMHTDIVENVSDEIIIFIVRIGNHKIR